MKIIFRGLILIAMANLLAIVGFAGWLVASDRLDMDRIRAARQTLSTTIAQEKAEKANELAKQEADAKALAEAAKASKPPMTASEQLSARLEATELDRERAARLKRDVETLQRNLTEQTDRLASERAAFDAERKLFASTNTMNAQRANDERFQRALGVISALKPAAAKSVLLEVMRTPAPNPQAAMNSAQVVAGATAEITNSAIDGTLYPAGMKEAVAYLEAMDDRVRSKIMTEITKDDPALAAKLLGVMRGDQTEHATTAASAT